MAQLCGEEGQAENEVDCFELPSQFVRATFLAMSIKWQAWGSTATVSEGRLALGKAAAASKGRPSSRPGWTSAAIADGGGKGHASTPDGNTYHHKIETPKLTQSYRIRIRIKNTFITADEVQGEPLPQVSLFRSKSAPDFGLEKMDDEIPGSSSADSS